MKRVPVWFRVGASAVVVLWLFVCVAHVGVRRATRMWPPELPGMVAQPITIAHGITHFGASYTRLSAGVREVYLVGSPEEIGSAHSALLYDRMVHNEAELWRTFANFVPLSAVRTLIIDTSLVRYRHLDLAIPEPRKRELAAEARGIHPDPLEGAMPTYQRGVFLHAVYDIALSFEHSPLIGCSAFALRGDATKDAHVLVGRAFDLEAGEVFDLDKAVFFVREDGTIPYASVSWPGMTGVVTGMNEEGVMVLVNGARARVPRTTGLPVVFSLREVLQGAHDTKGAVEILSRQETMVSHIVFVADAFGDFATVERAPGALAHVIRPAPKSDRVAVTNHFEGLLSDDPKNVLVKATTTTLARRERLDELLAPLGPHELTARGATSLLRDHGCAGGVPCPLGDRRAIDALIATHGVVADLTDRVLWVSRGPHLSGAFVRFDLASIFARSHDPENDAAPEVVEEDPVLRDGRYAAGRKTAGNTGSGADRR